MYSTIKAGESSKATTSAPRDEEGHEACMKFDVNQYQSNSTPRIGETTTQFTEGGRTREENDWQGRHYSKNHMCCLHHGDSDSSGVSFGENIYPLSSFPLPKTKIYEEPLYTYYPSRLGSDFLPFDQIDRLPRPVTFPPPEPRPSMNSIHDNYYPRDYTYPLGISGLVRLLRCIEENSIPVSRFKGLEPPSTRLGGNPLFCHNRGYADGECEFPRLGEMFTWEDFMRNNCFKDRDQAASLFNEFLSRGEVTVVGSDSVGGPLFKVVNASRIN